MVLACSGCILFFIRTGKIIKMTSMFLKEEKICYKMYLDHANRHGIVFEIYAAGYKKRPFEKGLGT